MKSSSYYVVGPLMLRTNKAANVIEYETDLESV